MRYISSKLLPHTITVRTIGEMDEDRNVTYTETEVSGVRVTPVRAWSKGSEGYTPADSMELISDNHTTTPAEFKPLVGMQIVFEGRKYTINSVKPCYTTTTEIHHYESVLV